MRIVTDFVLTCGMLLAMSALIPQYVTIGGGAAGFVILGALLTLMNMFARPFLYIITFPFHLLATLLTSVLVNLFFLYLLVSFAARLDPRVAQLAIHGGFKGWLIVAFVLGFGYWLLKHLLHAAKE